MFCVTWVQAGSGLKAGDMVKISQNAAYVKSQQDGHGGWNNKMRQVSYIKGPSFNLQGGGGGGL